MAMKYAVCNELFGDLSLREACAIIRRTGFSGVEFTPYTVFGDFSSGAVRSGIAEMKACLEVEGLEFTGFHWLMAKPEGLHFASPDAATVRKSRDHLAMLLDAAGEMGGGKLILGSPKQRSARTAAPDGSVSPARARAMLKEALSGLGPHARACKSELLIEQLSPDQSDIITMMADAVALVEEIGDEGISSMFDFHNSVSETAPWHELVLKFSKHIHHVHVNEVDGRAPGTGTSDYLPAWRALADTAYDGWVSIEIFEIPAGPEKMLEDSAALFARLDNVVRHQSPGRKK
jgi:sugar phosphate isomerase/epimerase